MLQQIVSWMEIWKISAHVIHFLSFAGVLPVIFGIFNPSSHLFQAGQKRKLTVKMTGLMGPSPGYGYVYSQSGIKFTHVVEFGWSLLPVVVDNTKQQSSQNSEVKKKKKNTNKKQKHMSYFVWVNTPLDKVRIDGFFLRMISWKYKRCHPYLFAAVVFVLCPGEVLWSFWSVVQDCVSHFTWQRSYIYALPWANYTWTLLYHKIYGSIQYSIFYLFCATLIKPKFIHTPDLIYTDWTFLPKPMCFHGYFPIKELISNATDTCNLQITHYQT